MTQRPIDWRGDYFEDNVRLARDMRGYSEPRGKEGEWGFLSRGKTIGKATPIKFVAANSAAQAQVSRQEILRINPRGEQADQLALPINVTLSAPQVLPGVAPGALPADLTTMGGGWMDNIDLANTLESAGGNAVGGPAGQDWIFANPIAVVTWGTGSIQNRVEADMANGLCLDIVAGWVIVYGMVESSGLTTTSGAYLIGANIGPSSGRTNNAQRTIQCGAIANNVMSSVFAVPRFAKSVRVSASDGSATPPLVAGSICFWRSQGGSVDAFGSGDFFFAGNSPVAIPIPNGSYYFSILGGYAPSGAGFAQPRYQAVFDLDL